MSESVKARAYAKINLYLRVLGKRGDYHEIETLQQSVDLYDDVTLEKRADGLVTSNIEGDNSIIALEKLQKDFSLGGMALTVTKHIPVGGGLGGSSADAAAACLACAKLWHLDEDAVRASVKDLFGDVAFQMIGGTAIARGIGSDVEALLPLPEYYALLAFPKEGVSTAEAYRLARPSTAGSDARALYDALRAGEKADDLYRNDLLQPATRLNGEIAPLLERMWDARALLTGMSGSGSALFSLYSTREDAEKAGDELPCRHLVVKTIGDISPQ